MGGEACSYAGVLVVGRMTTALGPPKAVQVTLDNGAIVLIRELTIAEAWPYINGEVVDPTSLIRKSVVDADGQLTIGADEDIPMAQALELLPHILKLNNLEKDDGGEVADLEVDFPPAVSAH